jgi:hypothetical protein
MNGPKFPGQVTRGLRQLDWQIERQDGKRVIYGVRQFTGDKLQHVVTIHVNEGKTAA